MFTRIDRKSKGLIDKNGISDYMVSNGFNDCEPDAFLPILQYFDLDGDLKLKYADFLQVVLTCERPDLRAETTQRPSQMMTEYDELPKRLESTMANLLVKERAMHEVWESHRGGIKNSMPDFSL